MKAQELDPAPRRLLRHLGRIDPQRSRLVLGEQRAADILKGKGLATVHTSHLGDVFAQITAAGRKALS